MPVVVILFSEVALFPAWTFAGIHIYLIFTQIYLIFSQNNGAEGVCHNIICRFFLYKGSTIDDIRGPQMICQTEGVWQCMKPETCRDDL